MDQILTVSEAAVFLGKYPGTIRRWIKSGTLKAKLIPAGSTGVYVLLRTDLLEYIVSETKRKPDPKPKIRKPVHPSPQVELPI